MRFPGRRSRRCPGNESWRVTGPNCRRTQHSCAHFSNATAVARSQRCLSTIVTAAPQPIEFDVSSASRGFPIRLSQGRSPASEARRHGSRPVVRPDYRMFPRSFAAPDISDSEQSPHFSGNHGTLALQPPAHVCQYSANLRLPAPGLEPARFRNAFGSARLRGRLSASEHVAAASAAR